MLFCFLFSVFELLPLHPELPL
ncbi:rCG48997 [Rattus norvegicus]|uniref:RCG48997 n=1 Tax=Rattus norvegicus TaxID=10116 RepID=A6IGZ1_RAT|nr:rCG48997 [Rattus norvegicus]